MQMAGWDLADLAMWLLRIIISGFEEAPNLRPWGTAQGTEAIFKCWSPRLFPTPALQRRWARPAAPSLCHSLFQGLVLPHKRCSWLSPRGAWAVESGPPKGCSSLYFVVQRPKILVEG